MPFFDLLPALGFFLLNVFVPGPNVLNTIATSTGSGYRAGLACAVACGLGILLASLVVPAALSSSSSSFCPFDSVAPLFLPLYRDVLHGSFPLILALVGSFSTCLA